MQKQGGHSSPIGRTSDRHKVLARIGFLRRRRQNLLLPADILTAGTSLLPGRTMSRREASMLVCSHHMDGEDTTILALLFEYPSGMVKVTPS